MWLSTDASLLDNFTSNFYHALKHDLDVRYSNKALLKMLLLMTLHCMDTLTNFTSHLSSSGKNITTNNCLHSLRNLLKGTGVKFSFDVDDSSFCLGMFQYS